MPTTALACATFLWIALTALLLGGALLRLVNRQTLAAPARLMLSLALGLPLIAYAVLALGLTGYLQRPWLAGLLLAGDVIGLLLGAYVLGDLLAGLRRMAGALRRSPQRLLWWLLMVWGLLVVLRALAPAGAADWDGLAEHLAMAKVWLQHSAVVPLWYEHHSQFPATVQMLYVLGLAWGGPVAAQLVNALFGFLAVGAVGWLARRHYGRASAAPAMVIFATMPLVGWLSAVAYVDMAATFYLTLSLIFFLKWLHRPQLAAALWCGAALGLGAAVKMQALPYLGVLAVGGLYVHWRRRGQSPGLPLRQLVALVALAATIASPWYIKSWILTGNPVYPFAYGVFGGKEWSAEQAQTYAYQQKSWGWGTLPPQEEFWSLPPLQRALAGPRRPDHLLLAPVGLTFLPARYVDPGFGEAAGFLMASPGPLFLAFLPLLLLIRRRPGAWRVTGWAVLPLWLWWLLTAQYSRYFLPAFAWLAPPAAYAAGEFLRRRWGRLAVNVALAGVALFALGAVALPLTGALPYLLGQQTAAAYLEEQLPNLYPALVYLNQQPGADGVISYGEPRLFYLDKPYMWGDPNYHRLLLYDRMNSGDDLLEAYRGLGLRYVLINHRFFPGAAPANEHIMALLNEAVAQGKLQSRPWGAYEVLTMTGSPTATAK
ncbi:MAG TPA: glycosyltransferase family 39 protein [Armatimonadota bacterium]|jgi:hypothetical protein